MRNLNLEELEEKISEYSSDIRYSDKKHLTIKFDQFFKFLLEQPISHRILERIGEDFDEVSTEIVKVLNQRNPKSIREFKEQILLTRELQGAFAYSELESKYFFEGSKYPNHYLDLSFEWYKPGGSYDDWQEYFYTYFLEPFIELIEWYISESKVRNEIDYFSKEEILRIENNFEELKYQTLKLQKGQEIIFNEADEIKQLLNGLNKKNWTELVKAKFNEMWLGKLISLETAELLIKTITGENIKLS